MDSTKLPTQAAQAKTEVTHGQVVAGRYQLHAEFVETPIGRLHLADDLSVPGRRVHVKLLPQTAFPSGMLMDRALRELRQLARSSSARVMRVLAQGRMPAGDLFVAYDAPPAQALLLDEVLRQRGALAPWQAVRISRRIGEALMEAQQVGVLHRNLAPYAVYLLPDDEVLVTDFPFAELFEIKGRLVQGSPCYLSPEQAEGKSIDQRSNVYNLGALLYHMLTGGPPHSGQNLSELLIRITQEVVAPASSRCPGLPEELDQLLGHALDRVTHRRQVTLRHLINELEAVEPLLPASEAAHAGVAPAAQHAHPQAAPGYKGEVASHAPAARFASTLVGMPAFVHAAAPGPPQARPAGPAPPVTPEALGRAFGAPHAEPRDPLDEHARAGAALPAPALPRELKPEADIGAPPDETATIPMPRLSEEEMMATFGLEVPLRGVSARAEGARAAAEIHTRVTQPIIHRDALPQPAEQGPREGAVAGEIPAREGAAEEIRALPPQAQEARELPGFAKQARSALDLQLTEPDQAPAPLPIASEPTLLESAAGSQSSDAPVMAKAPIQRPKAFRETAWFKQGEVQAMLEDPDKREEVVVSAEDHARLSLGSTGRTGMHRQPDLSALKKEAPPSDASALSVPEPRTSRLVLFGVSVLIASGVLVGLYLWLLAP